VPDTAEIIATLAREAQLQQLSSIESLDTKAASLIGFAGVVLGLLFTAPASTTRWNLAMTIGAGLIIFAVLPLAVALVPRKYAFNPNIEALERGWGAANPDEVQNAITKSILRALAANGESSRFKGIFVRIGVVLLVLGLLIAAIGVLYAVNTGKAPHAAGQPNGRSWS
jgi:uncharacterized membrane protein HdeD (DUF308 family)